MKTKINLFWLFFSFAQILSGHQWAVPFNDDIPDFSQENIAVVLGAGPAGLIAAHAILKSNRHSQIIIVEKRSAYSRFNFVNIFPESWPMLEELGVAGDFAQVGVSAEFLRIHNEFGDTEFDLCLDDGTPPQSFEYNGAVLESLGNPKVGLEIFNLADLQNSLSQSLRKNNRVYFVHGEARILDKNSHSSNHAIHLSYYKKELQADDISFTPDLVVVAEGAHSENRNNLDISLKPILGPSKWCSGSVSLKGIRENPSRFFQILDIGRKHELSTRNFGIFNIRESELFLNGEAALDESVDDCLKRNARELINFVNKLEENPFLSDEQEIEVLEKNQSIIDIIPSKAERFSSANNVILFGDAAGFGTPKGGIGLSLISSVFPQALLDLLMYWDIKDRNHLLESYDIRSSEIIDYWHIKISSDGVI